VGFFKSNLQVHFVTKQWHIVYDQPKHKRSITLYKFICSTPKKSTIEKRKTWNNGQWWLLLVAGAPVTPCRPQHVTRPTLDTVSHFVVRPEIYRAIFLLLLRSAAFFCTHFDTLVFLWWVVRVMKWQISIIGIKLTLFDTHFDTLVFLRWVVSVLKWPSSYLPALNSIIIGIKLTPTTEFSKLTLGKIFYSSNFQWHVIHFIRTNTHIKFLITMMFNYGEIWSWFCIINIASLCHLYIFCTIKSSILLVS
jgi:hypothetical protein